MSKLLYVSKILMFRKQFRLTVKEEKAANELCIFGILVYIEAWFTASNGLETYRSGLILLGHFFNFPKAATSKATSYKMSKHS